MRVALAVAVTVTVAVAACGPRRVGSAPILLFDGSGASAGDVAAIEGVLEANGLRYATADAARLQGMGAAEWGAVRLLIVPGGNFIEMAKGLGEGTVAKIHDAVNGGVNYLGICGGAFLAGTSTHYASVKLAAVQFRFYSAEDRGVRKAAVPIASVGGETLEQYWEDGPELSGWGSVVATYPDGTPAVVEGEAGKGWVVLAGIHPEAPASWRRGMTFATPVADDNAYAAKLVRAALERTELPHH